MSRSTLNRPINIHHVLGVSSLDIVAAPSADRAAYYGPQCVQPCVFTYYVRVFFDGLYRQLVFGGEFPDVENLDLYQGGHCFSDLVEDFSEDYHVYAVEWEVDSIR